MKRTPNHSGHPDAQPLPEERLAKKVLAAVEAPGVVSGKVMPKEPESWEVHPALHDSVAEATLETLSFPKLFELRCPKCGLELAEVEHREVIVDACFACGGIFLDKGELDKIVEAEKTGRRANFGRFLGGLFGS